MPPEVLKESRLTAATHTPWQAPLDRPAFVQAQHHARGERVAGAVGALDFARGHPDRRLPPECARPRRRRRSRPEVDHRELANAQAQQRPAAASRAGSATGPSITSMPVTAAASSSLMMMVSRCGRHGSVSSRIRAGCDADQLHVGAQAQLPWRGQHIGEAVAVGGRPVHALVHAGRAEVEDPGPRGAELEVLGASSAFAPGR